MMTSEQLASNAYFFFKSEGQSGAQILHNFNFIDVW